MAKKLRIKTKINKAIGTAIIGIIITVIGGLILHSLINNQEVKPLHSEMTLKRDLNLDHGLVNDLDSYKDIEGIEREAVIMLSGMGDQDVSTITYVLNKNYSKMQFDYYASGSDKEGYNRLLILRDEDEERCSYEVGGIPSINATGTMHSIDVTGVDSLTFMYKGSPGSSVLLQNIMFVR